MYRNNTKHINRNNSWEKGFVIREDEVIYLDVSMPQHTFRIGFAWWNLQDFVQKYFPDNFSYARMSDGMYDKLEVIGTCDEIKMIFDLYLERYSKRKNSLYFKQFLRYINSYLKKVERRENVQCLEAYLKSNMSGWE